MTIFGTWKWNFLRSAEGILIDKIKQNPSYPFRQENDVFVLEYYKNSIWKGTLLILASVIGILCMKLYREDQPNNAGFLIFGVCISLWLICSGAFCHCLVIDHKTKEYRCYVRNHLWHRAPLYRIYIRMIAQKCDSSNDKIVGTPG